MEHIELILHIYSILGEVGEDQDHRNQITISSLVCHEITVKRRLPSVAHGSLPVEFVLVGR